MQQKRGPQLVQSLERGLVALEMALEGSVRPSKVAAALGIDRSSAYRLLYTLMAKGYLLQDERTREFTSNPTKFFQLYSKVATLLDWPDVAARFLTMLREESGETANLGVRQANNVIYIAHRPGQAALSVNFALGTSRPLHCSALGKALLAAQPDTATDSWVATTPLTAYTAKTIIEPTVLSRHLRAVRADGYAVDDEETFAGVRCIAAPIYDHRQQVIAALGISGPSTRITHERLPHCAQIVMRIAAQLSADLGAADAAAHGNGTGKTTMQPRNQNR